MRLAIVYPRANLDTVPSLIGAAEQLAEAGHEVDVFTYRQAGQPEPEFMLTAHPPARRSASRVWPITPRLACAAPSNAWAGCRALRGHPSLRGYNVLGAGLAGRQPTGSARPERGCRARDPVRMRDRRRSRRAGAGAPLGPRRAARLLLAGAAAVVRAEHAVERQLKATRASAQPAGGVRHRPGRGARPSARRGQRPGLVSAWCWCPTRRPGQPAAGPALLAHPLRAAGRRPCSGALGQSGRLDGHRGDRRFGRHLAPHWVLVIHTRYDAESSAYVEDLRARADPRACGFRSGPFPVRSTIR